MKGVLLKNINSNGFLTNNTNKSLIYSTTNGDLNMSNNGTDTQITTALSSPIKLNVRVASTANVNLSSTLNSTSIDGVTVSVGDRVLLKDQTSGVQNGIYVVNSGLATRASDMITSENVANYIIAVNQGTLNAESMWTCYNTIGSDVVGTNSLTFILTETNNNVEVLTSAGAISPIKELTIINDATAQLLSSMPVYTLASGVNGQRKRIVSNLGNVRVTISNLNNQGGQVTLYSGIPCDLVYYNAAWYATNDNLTYYPYNQQGSKLIGSGGATSQGFSVAISYDGNTVAIGSQSTVWIFTRSNSVWTQQGGPLTPSDGVGGPNFGTSVALSADGNTLVAGASNDNSSIGATWVFSRSGGVWSQVGLKLIGSGATGAASQGAKVSISGDGLTFATGGNTDNSSVGAVWIFVFSGGVWTQQGTKLVGTGNTGASQMSTCKLIYDGNLLVIGGFADNTNTGAIWVFTRSGTTWSQRGSKITPSPSSTTSGFGVSLSLSSDGALLAVGAGQFSGSTGRAYVFRSVVGDAFNALNPYYVQVPGYFRGANQVGASIYGNSIALSKQGKTLVISGPGDNSNNGAIWVYITQDGGSTWNLVESKITGTGAFGIDINISENGSTLVVGAYLDSSSGTTTIFT